MRPAQKIQDCHVKTMRENIRKVNNSLHLLPEWEIAEIFKTSFENDLLRFIIINGEEYVANIHLHLRGVIFLEYTNPHQFNRDLRVSYNPHEKFLFVEKMKMIPHPSLRSQRVVGEMATLCSFFSYEEFGYVDPQEKVPKWNEALRIPLAQITALKMDLFWDRPAIWHTNEDYIAYKIIIETTKV